LRREETKLDGLKVTHNPLPTLLRALIGPCLLVGLSACTSLADSNRQTWVPGPAGSREAAPAALDLNRDLGLCQKTAQSLQGEQADSYSDPRYGAVNAMTAALARREIGGESRRNGERARMELCMMGRGWVRSN
jgi:hypothetical protein